MAGPEPTYDEQDLLATAMRLRIGIGAFRRRAHETKAGGDIPAPALAALSRLEREGPMTTAELARREQITPQSMGATMTGLQEQGFVRRRPDPTDGRRSVLSLAPAGREAVHTGRSALTERIAGALGRSFSPAEIATLDAAGQLLERLAHQL